MKYIKGIHKGGVTVTLWENDGIWIVKGNRWSAYYGNYQRAMKATICSAKAGKFCEKEIHKTFS